MSEVSNSRQSIQWRFRNKKTTVEPMVTDVPMTDIDAQSMSKSPLPENGVTSARDSPIDEKPATADDDDTGDEADKDETQPAV